MESSTAAPVSAEATGPQAAPPATLVQLLLVAVLSFTIMIIDGYDIGAMPIIVPHLASLWGVAPATFGPALSAVVIGLGLGAFLFAPLGDRFGRRMTTVVSLTLVSFATLGTAWSGSVGALFWWRLLTGVGLGTCLPNVLALLAQVVPADRRASAMTVISCGIPVGAAGAGPVVPWLTMAYGWEAAFYGPAMFMFVVTAFVALYLRQLPVPDAAPRPPRGPWRWTDIPVLAPLGHGYALRTAVFCGIFCFNSVSMYMLTSWLPTLLRGVGFSFEGSSLLASVLQIGGLLGGLVLAVQMDRQRTVGALLVGYAVVALCLVALALVAPAIAAWGTILLLVGMGVGGAHMAMPAVAAGIYPATMLSAGIGLAVTIARLGAMAGPMIGAALVGAQIPAGGFFLVLLAPVAGCVLCVLAFARILKAHRSSAPTG